MKINKLFILAALSLSLVSCSDLFEPAQENNRSLDEIYEEPTYAQGLLGYALDRDKHP
jgi:starch-binding outer membrane protein, SusD/RagB family